MTGPAPFHLGGHRLLLDPLGAVFWPAQHRLMVADLHLEKGSAAALRGQLVPPFDTRATLDRLALLLRRYRPRQFVSLGDAFHDAKASSRLLAADRARLLHLLEGLEPIWLCGNHDPLPPDLPGRHAATLMLDAILLRHAPDPAASWPEICGHLHPKARITHRGTTISRPCFVASPARLLLPAFGTYTGGLDVADPAIGSLFAKGARALLLGHDRLFSFALPARRRVRASLTRDESLT